VTQKEWLACSDPEPLLAHLSRSKRFKKLDRKWRLLGCAFARQGWSLLTARRSRNAIEVSEKHADGRATKRELEKGFFAAHAALRARKRSFWEKEGFPVTLELPNIDSIYEAAAAAANLDDIMVAATVTARLITGTVLARPRNPGRKTLALLQNQADIVRDVFGNPFKRSRVKPGQLTTDRRCVKLAASIYKHRSFDRMSELADALEQAGCTNQDILNHCRRPGPHTRGCWVVDLLLGKS